jgi:hypothetical protein
MLHGKRAPTKPKHGRKALPVLGAAGLSLSLAGAASAAAIGGPTTDMLTRNAGVSHENNLSEEEIADVSLATFYVVDNEGAATSGRGARLAMGCGGCGGGWLRRLLVEQRLPGADDLEQCRHAFGQPHPQSRTSAQVHIGSAIPVKLTSDAPTRDERSASRPTSPHVPTYCGHSRPMRTTARAAACATRARRAQPKTRNTYLEL